MNISWF